MYFCFILLHFCFILLHYDLIYILLFLLILFITHFMLLIPSLSQIYCLSYLLSPSNDELMLLWNGSSTRNAVVKLECCRFDSRSRWPRYWGVTKMLQNTSEPLVTFNLCFLDQKCKRAREEACCGGLNTGRRGRDGLFFRERMFASDRLAAVGGFSGQARRSSRAHFCRRRVVLWRCHLKSATLI